jgi:hypothetical protein
MKFIFAITSCFTLILFSVLFCKAQEPEETEVWEPEPIVVTPGATVHEPPSDAIILFDGKDLSQWVGEDGKEPQWKVEDGVMTVVKGTGEIRTKAGFGSVQLHIEWRTPAEIEGAGQGRGNSGVFLQDRYEVQVLDSYENRTYSNGQAASIYKQHIPLANASRPPGEWQTYDIIFTAPIFDANGELARHAYVTVIHNGVLVQDHVAFRGPTQYIGQPKYEAHEEKLPLQLQDHSNPVSYRNIWIREL